MNPGIAAYWKEAAEIPELDASAQVDA